MAERRLRVTELFGDRGSAAAMEVLTLVELAWHDVYGEVTPPEEVVNDILVWSEGDLARLAHAGLEAVMDWRDLRLAANDLRNRAPGAPGA